MIAECIVKNPIWGPWGVESGVVCLQRGQLLYEHGLVDVDWTQQVGFTMEVVVWILT